MLACVDAGNVKKAETPTSPIPTAPEAAANIFEKRVMCASLSTGRVPSGVIGTRSQPAGQRCAPAHAGWFSAFTLRLERALQRLGAAYNIKTQPPDLAGAKPVVMAPRNPELPCDFGRRQLELQRQEDLLKGGWFHSVRLVVLE
jgi:hypothetical protein